MTSRALRIAIIGAGPGGLCMGKRLLDEGFDDFVLLERANDVGGTWNRNRYPGCECDVPSALYSFSFEFKADWSKPYGTQPEILAYMQRHRRQVRAATPLPVRRRRRPRALERHDLDVDAHARFGSHGRGRRRRQRDRDVQRAVAGPTSTGSTRSRGAMWHSAQWNWDHDLARRARSR